MTANFQGTFTFVAANGDKLVTHYGTGYTGKLTGQLSAGGTALVGVQFDAIFTIDGAESTGQFAGASGSWRMIAHADSISLISMVPGYSAPFNYTWTGGGTIIFANKNTDLPRRRQSTALTPRRAFAQARRVLKEGGRPRPRQPSMTAPFTYPVAPHVRQHGLLGQDGRFRDRFLAAGWRGWVKDKPPEDE